MLRCALTRLKPAFTSSFVRLGFDPTTPTLRETWSVFRQFVREEVETRSDGVLVQAGTYSFHGPERYTFDFLRQFEVTCEDGEHDRYEQLHCRFEFEPTPELKALGWFNDWWFADGGSAVEPYLDLMQDRPEFIAVADLQPVEAKVEQEAV